MHTYLKAKCLNHLAQNMINQPTIVKEEYNHDKFVEMVHVMSKISLVYIICYEFLNFLACQISIHIIKMLV